MKSTLMTPDRIVAAVRQQQQRFQRLSDATLRDHTDELRRLRKSQHRHNRSISSGWQRWKRPDAAEPMIEAHGLMAEALRRTTGKLYYDVQLQAGWILAAGSIAEMQTGEGKTITTGLPAFWQALAGRGCHVSTVNDYLARRDFETLQPTFELLGVGVGRIDSEMSLAEKRQAYRCEVTYGPGFEFGFDFLRDQIALRSAPRPRLGMRHLAHLRGQSIDKPHSLIGRPLACAVIDEADSVLIDEANTPLILSGQEHAMRQASSDPEAYRVADILAQELQPEEDFSLDPVDRKISFTPTGWFRIHEHFAKANPLRLARAWSCYVENALRARQIFRRDVDYVVRDGEIQIVDQNTGRIHPERSWRNGLHQAVQTKERVAVVPEQQTQARITRQRFIGQYDSICGLTGTAQAAARELKDFYRLSVVSVPTHRPCHRFGLPSRHFSNLQTKHASIVAEIRARHANGGPMLVGTRTIAESRTLSAALHNCGIPHRTLNGIQDEAEADLIAIAGQPGAITIATNMAGRGTDIALTDASRARGGLHVIATEHHPCARVDRQLIGRAARQGDPGSYQFFVSAEDEIFQHAPQLAESISARCSGAPEAQHDFSTEIARLQNDLENQAYQRRTQLTRADQWLDRVLETVAKEAV
ncbi:preprotein translocase subunit SecA [Rosistilla ulvae]|uniref:Protein translocase subunit SecA n=1 Tax=Rosistilla ulvae TaxID=1930277 RepID=A0A517M3S9_9BACT|nr:translocase [Rosistilla ulvae]QDS89525.1 preprotein translocase subunit SecA [Rosistilla ulvae]